MSLEVDIEKKLDGFTLRAQISIGDEPLALLGASGSGKSMTLRCIAGVMRPDRGRIVLNGKTLFDSEKRIDLPPQKRQVGLLFQNYALFPTMNVERNIACGARRAGQCDLTALIRQLGLAGLERRMPHELSGGQQQRVALARILASQPRILLLDEPFSALDSSLRWQVEQQLDEVISRFTGTTILVSHNREEAYRLCRQVVVVDHGTMEPVRDRRVLYEQPGTRAAAQLTDCKNLADGQPAADGLYLPAWNLTLCSQHSLSGADGAALRAEALHPAAAGEENVFDAVVERILDSPLTVVALVRPTGAAECLRWEFPAGQLALYVGDNVRLAVAPRDVLPLKG